MPRAVQNEAADAEPGAAAMPLFPLSSMERPGSAVDGMATLPRGEVHVWLADLDRGAPAAHEVEALVSPEEIERAQRLRFDADRRRFVARRAILRRVLAEHLGITPADVAYEVGERGKPRVAAGPEDLRFSASSSGGVCAVALARERDVGVDLERVRGDVDVEAVARRALPPEEARALSRLSGEERTAAFFVHWVAVEAALKLSGEGIAGLDRAREASATPTVTPLSAPDGYVAALATHGPPPVVVERRWPGGSAV